MSTAQAELTHALAFLYLAIGQATDDNLTAEEMRTLADKLHKRAPDLSLDELGPHGRVFSRRAGCARCPGEHARRGLARARP